MKANNILLLLICFQFSFFSCNEREEDRIKYFKNNRENFQELLKYLEVNYINNSAYLEFPTVNLVVKEPVLLKTMIIDQHAIKLFSRLGITSILITSWGGCKTKGFDTIIFKIIDSNNYFEYNYCPIEGLTSMSGKVVAYELGDDWYYVEDNS